MKNISILNISGFTLIELLIVVLIIGILSAVALPQYQVVVAKTKIARNIPKLRALKDAQELYFMANGRYTDDWSLLDIDGIEGCRVEQDDGNGRWYLCEEARYRTYMNTYVEMQELNPPRKWIYMYFLDHGGSGFRYTDGQGSCLGLLTDKTYSKACESLSDGTCRNAYGWHACRIP